MARRTDRVRRIAVLQAQLHRLAEWHLCDLQRQEVELEARRQDLVAALNDDQRLQGLFVDSTARRLNAVGAESSIVTRAKENQTGRVFAEGLRLKQIRRVADTAAQRDLRAEGRRDLQAAIDASLSRSIGDAWFDFEYAADRR